jgi:hypothetical protein
MYKNEEAEIIKKKYQYRKLILNGKLKLNIDIAKKLVGPDSAFHLYSYYSLYKNRKYI